MGQRTENQSPATSDVGFESVDLPVIDVDVHPTYGSDVIRRDLAERMAEPYGSYLHPETETEGTAYPSNGWPKTLGGNRSGTWVTELLDGDDVQTEIEAMGIDYVLLDQIAPIDSVQETARAVEEMRAANDILVERYLDGHENIFGLLNIAARTPDEAAEEIDRLGDERQIKGIVLFPGAEHQKPLGDPRYDVIYSAAEDSDLTVVIHAVDGAMPRKSTPILQELEKFVSMHTLGFPWSAMLTLTSLIVQGTPEKFSDLDFVFTEGGLGWVPFLMGRLNREVGWRKSEAPLLNRPPESYIRDSFYFGTQPLEEPNDISDLCELLQILGPDMLMFASDYPHWDFDNPSSTVDVLRRAFSDEEVEQVLYGNAESVFDI